MLMRRLEAESIRDAMLSMSGRIADTLYGPPVPVMPDDVGQIVIGVDTRDTAGRPTGEIVPLGSTQFRRSVYVQVRRSMPLGVLQVFDEPLMTPNCELRATSTVSPQALFMMNSGFVEEEAETMATRIAKEAPAGDLESQFRAAWQLVFGNSPQDRDRREGIAFLDRQTRILASDRSSHSPTRGRGPKVSALGHLCQALLISNGFLYVD
jgi:hypothetical protein